jgi:PASTA domain
VLCLPRRYGALAGAGNRVNYRPSAARTPQSAWLRRREAIATQLLLTWIYEWVVSMLQPSVVRVPDVCQMRTVTARSQLRKLGLRARAVEPEGPGGYLVVRAQDPAPGTEAKRHTVVTLYLVSGEGVEYAV